MTAVTTKRNVSYWQIIVWMMVGLLIVAHGCHAGRDTELMKRSVIRNSG
jgi:hypothetical protein